MADETKKAASVAQLQELAARTDEGIKAVRSGQSEAAATLGASVSAAVAGALGSLVATQWQQVQALLPGLVGKAVEDVVTAAMEAQSQRLEAVMEQQRSEFAQLRLDCMAPRTRTGSARLPDGGLIQMTVTEGVGTATLPDGSSIPISGSTARN